MKKKAINIISLDTPYPDNYGGIIDIFQKIKSLHSLGINIHLHCFSKDKKKSKELEKYCQSVKYYKRNKNWQKWFSLTPFIVKSRDNKPLLKNLLKNKFPILFEGIHTTYLADHKKLANRKLFLRTHNVEQDYYHALYLKESNVFKKLFFFSEYLKLKKYENNLKSVDSVFSITEKDNTYFSQFYYSELVQVFHQEKEVKTKEGKGNFALYHGNLSVLENQEAVLYFTNNIFSEIDYPLVIAGKNPSKKLKTEIKKNKKIKLVENPSDKQINDLIGSAHINILSTHQETGIKLKLLKSLFLGRHCLVNDKMLHGTELSTFCNIANSKTEWLEQINKLQKKAFTKKDLENRSKIKELYNNEEEAKKIIEFIF
ncbi:hypothetical protein N9H19_02810 [Flavobacteriales bacterium]|nr:hypothetical protein [Flavobacteriales bacterium]